MKEEKIKEMLIKARLIGSIILLVLILTLIYIERNDGYETNYYNQKIIYNNNIYNCIEGCEYAFKRIASSNNTIAINNFNIIECREHCEENEK